MIRIEEMFVTQPTEEYLETLGRNILELGGSDTRESEQARKAGDKSLE
jgi:hypothetical protein